MMPHLLGHLGVEPFPAEKRAKLAEEIHRFVMLATRHSMPATS